MASSLVQWQVFDNFIKEFKKQDVISVHAIQYEECAESNPCAGHEGVTIAFADGSGWIIECDSPTIGAVMYWFDPSKKNEYHEYSHFTKYLTPGDRERIDKSK